MVIVRDIKEFAVKNEDHLKRFFRYKTGIYDPEIIKDHLQEFYVRLIQTNALQTFNEKEGNFDNYISTLFCWLLPILARKNFRAKHNVVSTITIRDKRWLEFDDVYNYVNKDFGLYKIDDRYPSPDTQSEEAEKRAYSYLDDFKKFIRRTEPKQQAHQMVIFLDQKQEGCKSTEIAVMLKVSDNMVKIIKKRVQKKFRLWQEITKVN